MAILLTVLAVGGAAAVAVVIGRSLLRLRGTHLVTCPETRAPAAVEVDLKYAAVGATVGRPVLRLSHCSRWPERGGCGQPCLDELEASPEDCLLRNILRRWYEGKRCVGCGHPFGELHWHDHKPALLAPDGSLREWHELAPETVPLALATHRPLCWNCLIVESLYRDHPELVTLRPPYTPRGAAARPERRPQAAAK